MLVVVLTNIFRCLNQTFIQSNYLILFAIHKAFIISFIHICAFSSTEPEDFNLKYSQELNSQVRLVSYLITKALLHMKNAVV